MHFDLCRPFTFCLMLFSKRRFLTFFSDQWYQHQNNNDSSIRAAQCLSLCWEEAVWFFPKEQKNPLSHGTSYHFRADRKPFSLCPPSPFKTAVIAEPMWLRPVKFYQPKVPGDTLSAAPHDPSPLGNGLKTALLMTFKSKWTKWIWMKYGT